MRLEARTIMLTGAAGGMGRACALRFASEGANVVGVDVDGPGLREVGDMVAQAGAGTFVAAEADLSSPAGCAQAVATAVDAHGALDVLFHHAGVPGPGGLDVDEAAYDRVMNIAVKAGFFLARYAVPHLEKADQPAILLTSSVAGLKGSPLSVVYGAAKGAIITLTKNLAAALAPKGIRVNSISPGAMDTPFVKHALSDSGLDADAVMAASVARIPLGRLGRAEEMAGLAAFLVSREASYITGANFVIDGGLLVG